MKVDTSLNMSLLQKQATEPLVADAQLNQEILPEELMKVLRAWNPNSSTSLCPESKIIFHIVNEKQNLIISSTDQHLLIIQTPELDSDNFETFRTNLKITKIKTESTARSLVMKSDATMFYSGHENGTIFSWDLTTISERSRPKKTQREHKDCVVFLGLAQSDSYLISASHDNTVIKWDEDLTNPTEPGKHKGRITCVKLTEKYVITSSEDHTIKIFDHTIDLIHKITFDEHKYEILCMDVNDNTLILFSFSFCK